MNCVFCKKGTTQAGVSSITLEKAGLIFLIQDVPGDICNICNHAYFTDATTDKIEKLIMSANAERGEVKVIPFHVA